MRKMSTVDFVTLTPLPGKEAKTKGRSGLTIVLILAACLIIMAVLVACNSGSTQPTQASAATSASMAPRCWIHVARSATAPTGPGKPRKRTISGIRR
jgi:hypothetical protein